MGIWYRRNVWYGVGDLSDSVVRSTEPFLGGVLGVVRVSYGCLTTTTLVYWSHWQSVGESRRQEASYRKAEELNVYAKNADGRMRWIRILCSPQAKGTTLNMHIVLQSHPRPLCLYSFALLSSGNSCSPSSLKRVVATLVPICLVCDPKATTLSALS